MKVYPYRSSSLEKRVKEALCERGSLYLHHIPAKRAKKHSLDECSNPKCKLIWSSAMEYGGSLDWLKV